MNPSPELSKAFLTESVLRANAWEPALLTQRRRYNHHGGGTESFTDYHLLQFLEKWEEEDEFGIWEPGKTRESFAGWRPAWEAQILTWFESLKLPAWNIEWFFKECERVWWGEWRERNAIVEHAKIVEELRHIPQPEQRSPEWYAMREGMITASDWATVVGMNPYNSLKQFLDKKTGVEKPFTGNEITQFGVKHEPVANKIYERRMETTVDEFGLLPHPLFSFLGASPDGITNEGRMLEIKCPPKRTITGIPPKYYWVQMQGQLEVCRLDRCDFLECKIEETTDRDEWNDNKLRSVVGSIASGSPSWEWGTLSQSPDGYMEKGVVAEFTNGEKLHYAYWYAWEDDYLTEWIAKQESLPGFIRVVYWSLTQMSCVPIYRDQEFFNKTGLPKLAQAWNAILWMRSQHEPDTELLAPPPPEPLSVEASAAADEDPLMKKKTTTSRRAVAKKPSEPVRNPFLDVDL